MKTTQQKTICKHCQQVVKHNYIIINGEVVCLECLKQHYIYCLNCGLWHLKDEKSIATIKGKKYYSCCLENEIIKKCSICGGYDLSNNFTTILNKTYCSKCYQRKTKIKSFRNNPDLIFKGENAPFYIGFELETRNPNLNDAENNYICDLIDKAIGETKTFYKYDGSVYGGFEIVSHPHSFDNLKTAGFEKMFDILNDYNFTKQDDDCGFHLHFSRGYLKTFNVYALVYFYSKHYEKFFNLSKRKQYNATRWSPANINEHLLNRFFTTLPTNEDDFNSLVKHNKISDRYCAVNLTNENTIEFRLGASVLDFDFFNLWIDLHNTIFTNAKNITLENINNIEAWFNGRDDLLTIFKEA